MSGPRQNVRAYVQASEALLETEDLSDTEMEMVQEMLYRLSEKLLNSGNDSQP